MEKAQENQDINTEEIVETKSDKNEIVTETIDSAKKIITETRTKNCFTPSDSILASVSNAEIMLTYITEHGIDIKKEYVETVINSKYLCEQNQWSPEVEVDMRIVYKELTKLIAPVTVDSLIASKPTPRRNPGKIAKFLGMENKQPLSQRSVTIYTFVAIFIMALLLIVQIYFYLGSTRLNRIQDCNQKIAEKEARMNELMLVKNSGASNSSIDLEYEQIINEIAEIDNEKSSNIKHLIPWVEFLKDLTNIHKEEKEIEEIESDEITSAEKSIREATDTIQEAQSYLIILGIYLLPLLYGLVGGFSFVLREITSEIRNLTFSRVTNTKYLLRIVLGLLAGLSIGLFWGDLEKTQQFGLASLSPMLLAFLAGYCVEYLFMFIEKFVLSFFKKHENNEEKKENK
ncbi:MAG: DUF2157 domain-containing protein [Bacteroidales bacterium]|nr:DUF2157 domain-containing protein [Bacteroidales bacterium]